MNAAHIPEVQLELPFDPGALRVWTVRLPGPAEAALEVVLEAGGAGAQLYGRWLFEDGRWSARLRQWELWIQVQPPAELRSTAIDQAGPLLGLPADSRDGLDPLLADAVHYAVAMLGAPADGPAPGEWAAYEEAEVAASEKAEVAASEEAEVAARRARGSPGAALTPPADIRLFVASLRALQAHVQGVHVPHAARAARDFAWPARWFVYALAAGDPTGRVAQLADSCPGLLLLLQALEHRARDDLPALVAPVVAGQRLSHCLGAALEQWTALGGGPGGAETQRLRVLRAGVRVPCELLWRAPDLPFIPEDVPQDPWDNAAWFRWQDAVSQLPHRFAPGQREVLARFVSRHAVTLENLGVDGDPGDLDEDDVPFMRPNAAWLADYLLATGRRPHRRADPVRLVHDVDLWHQRHLWTVLHPLETPLPPGPVELLDHWSHGPHTMRRLKTVGELIAESERMHHCVASHADAAVAGRAFIFHGEVDGAPLTVEVLAGEGGLVLGEVSGVANRAATVVQRRVLCLWAQEVGQSKAGR